MAKSKALELSIQIAGRLDKSLIQSVTKANGILTTLTSAASRVGTVGLAGMAAAAMGTAAAIDKCSQAASELETSMAPVARYVEGLVDASGNINTEKYRQMKTYIQDLSTTIPRTTDQIATMSAALGQSGMGYDVQANRGVLRDTAVAATAMDLDDQTAGDYMAKWEVSFNFDHDQVMELMDQINYLGANNATTAAEIASTVNATASMGQLAGLDPSATAALATAMQAMGVSSDRAANAIKRTYTNLSLGAGATKAAKEMWQELGFSAEGVARAMQSDGIGTLKQVFSAIQEMPEERKVAALKTLFGQWAIEGDAKIVNNMAALIKTLDEVDDPSRYTGSMEREFIIQAGTSESVSMMADNARTALAQTVGESFLPVKKQWALMLTDLYNGLRKNTPALTELGESLAQVLSNGVEKLGQAMQTALPFVQKGLDYLANNGDQVAETLKKITLAFVGMKFSPQLLSGVSWLGELIGGKPTAGSGRKRTGGLLSFAGAGHRAVNSLNTVWASGQAAAGMAEGGALSRAKLGITGMFGALGNLSGLNSGKINQRAAAQSNISALVQRVKNRGLVKSLWDSAANSGVGQYLGNVGGSLGGLFNAMGETSTGQFLSGKLGAVTLPLRQKAAGLGLSAALRAGVIGQKVSGAAGTVASLVTGGWNRLANSGVGQVVGGALQSGKSVLSAGAGVLGNVWSPVTSLFGGLFTSAAPVIAAVSGVIAVVSILGDHLEDIRGIVGNVFGEKGLAVFDTFTEKIRGVGQFISGLFQEGGVANALAPLREMVTGVFGEKGGGAFDGLVSILQSVMGVIGQIVDFATGTVKPIIENIFQFISGTVVPVLVQSFTTAAPYIAGIIRGLGSAIMTVMGYIGQAIQSVLPIIEGIIAAVLNVASVVSPALLAGFQVMVDGILPIIEAVKGMFDGLVTFWKGVFSGDLEMVLEGIKTMFGNAFNAVAGLIKTPINAVLALINGVFDRIGEMHLKIPDWVPVLGGKEYTVGLPHFDLLAKGGFTRGVSIAGEAGTEAVISFQSGVRGKNIDTWIKAGQMLGVNGSHAASAANLSDLERRKVELKDFDPMPRNGDGGGNGGGLNVTINVTVNGNADREDIDGALTAAEERWKRWYEKMKRDEERKRY